MEGQGTGLRRVLLLSFCVAGIWAAYIYQGVLQEILSTKKFGEDGKRFEHLAFLNLAQNVVCLVWSYIMIKLWSNGGSGGAPWWTYWSAGITNTIGPAMGIEALKYISYPAQVLAKSSKMIPVMLMGSLVYGIRYSLPEYLCTFLVAGGVSMFALLKTSSKTISKLAHPNAPLGYGLCFLNLAFDGFTNATQDSITARLISNITETRIVAAGESKVMEGQGTGLRRVLLLSFCVAGIWAAYIYQGVLQEILSTKKFGEDGKRFEHLAFLNLAQNVVCLVWSYIMIKLWSNGGSGGAPWWTYWSAGITNTIGPAMGIEALKYISYPAQVLAKSSKMIPVMLMGSLVYGIRYSLPEYLCTFLVAGGVSMFALLKTSSKTISKLAHPNAPLGYGLCFLNLAFDGFTNATQDSITARYPKTNAWDIMLGMNLWGTIYNMVYMFGLPHGSGFEAVQFCKQHPEAAWDILMYCLCGAVGQNFIFLTISRFGSLANTTITTTRKFVSIVVSSVLSGNPLSSKQWGCVSMVFGGLSYQIYLKWRKLQRVQKKKKT
ncbi:hypothetical protein Bca52824_006486 [Brassica carinata]|uniref:UDP-galactose transporter 3 n=1 Tax=Brassica carinata TaxID=52824 RepID=A0A8X7W844_BRACI|nr:hypothetical protein Bca52824_006486 [Brassica carinata]